MIIVSFVILLFLWHFPSAIIPILTIPISVLLAFIPLYGMKLTSNIMSLSGIAISIGVLVDGAIVEVENAYKKLQLWQAGRPEGRFSRGPAERPQGSRAVRLLFAAGHRRRLPAGVHAGRPGRPAVQAAGLQQEPGHGHRRSARHHARPGHAHAVHPDGLPSFPAAAGSRGSRIRSRSANIMPEEKHPISKILFRIYEPACRFVLKYRKATIIAALLLMVATVPIYFKLGSEFMPPLNEGTILYMPTTLPGISVTETQSLLQTMDKILKETPEVERVFGKAGRAETSTDPAPFSHDGDDRRPEAGERVAEGQALVFRASRDPAKAVPAHLARPDHLGRDRQRARPEDAVSRRLQRLDHADQGQDRHADDGRAHARRHQDLRRGLERDRKDRHSSSRGS